MSRENQKSYIAEFKTSAAKTAEEMGINPNIHCLYMDTSIRRPNAEKAAQTDEHLHDELKRLKKENTRLIEECELWTKPHFARETQ